MDIIAPCLVLGLAFGRIGCLLNGCCWGEVCETGPAITFPYHSPPYMEQVASGQIKNVPDALYVTTESGGSRLITPDELRAKAALAPLAQAQHSLPVHPSQAYSAITGFILTALLVAFLTLAPAPGRVFALMLILEGGTRFLLEMLRVEPAILGTGTHKLSFLPPMSVSMVIAACLFVAGIVLWLTFKSSRREEKPSELIK
jgi:phosphatidylglycerol:prolipoprotein diacylglycerol transferase